MAPDYEAVPLEDEEQKSALPMGCAHDQKAQRKRGRWQQAKLALQSLAGLLLALVLAKIGLSLLGYDLAIHVALVSRPSGQSEQQQQQQQGQQKQETGGRGKDAALTTKAPRANVWMPISAEDNTAVWNWLHDPARGLNLTAPEQAKINDNQVFWIDTVPLNKSDVLPFLDSSGARPASYARVVVYEGGRAEPVVQEYMVGPLPVVDGETQMEKLDYIYNGGMGGTVPYNARGMDAARRLALDSVLVPAMEEIADITAALFLGMAYHGMEDRRTTVTMTSGNPLSQDGRQARYYAVFHYPGPAMYLLPIDFYVLVDWAGTDTRLWSVRSFVTHGRVFADAAALRAAYEAGELAPAAGPGQGQRRDYDWALVKYQPALGERPLERRAAPQTREVGGKRYRVDAQERYVEYMGWSFYVAHSRMLGPVFYDIRFRGERILYELSMQEAASQYGGWQPKAASTVYHDASYSFGTFAFSLVEGFDCPHGSTFWNLTFHERNRTRTHERALCLFESDPGHPLSRHRASERWWTNDTADKVEEDEDAFDSLGVVRHAHLNVRFVATVGNYDYLFTYAFGLDGALDISVRASGYLMSSPYYAGEQGARYGPRIQQATQGSIHDHVITFKADFDIVNTTNSLQKTVLRAVRQRQPWFDEGVDGPGDEEGDDTGDEHGSFEQLQLETSVVAEEQQIDWDPNLQTMYSVVNPTAQNAWGENRGYRIVPGLSNIRLSTPNSPWSRRNMAFAKSHLAVTRQHDTEPFANSLHNVNLPLRPQQDFARFFEDRESVDGEDLVVWFNLGMHHFTRAEDVPVTLFSEAVSSITLAPQNFFDRAQDGDLRNRLWMVSDKGSGMHVEDYGVEYQ